MKKPYTIYTRLAELREDLDLTQEQLAEILGVSTKMVSNYETGANALPIDKALILSEKYGYSLDWLYKKYNINFDNCKDFLIDIRKWVYQNANSHFLRTAGPHFPDSPGHIKRTAWDISRAEGSPPY